MRILIRIVFVIFIENGIDCLGSDNCCDNCCDCFKDKDENEKIEEYEEIKEDKNNTAKSLVNDAWYNAKENKPILKIFVKKEDNASPSESNGDKISIKSDEKGNPKIVYQNEKKVPLNLKGKKYAFFEIKTQEGKNTVYLYCSDVEGFSFNGIFEKTTHVSISVIACNTKNVTNMYSMFSDCSSLTDLDIRKFNTTNVKNMAFMFTNCSRLAKLDLKNFNTKNVTNMEYMFSGCTSLKELKFGDNFNTTSVEKMNYMFYKCVKLSEEFKKNILGENKYSQNKLLEEFQSSL